MNVSSSGNQIAKAVAAFRADRRLRHQKAVKAAGLLDRNEVASAEAVLAPYLEKHPGDAAALNLMAEIATKLGQHARAETLLANCLGLLPEFGLARFNHAWALHNLNRLPAALTDVERLLESDPHNFLALDLKAVVLALMGRYAEAMLCRRQLVTDYPEDCEVWIKYGAALRGLGERDAAISAWLSAIGFRPSAGAAWWGLADIKSYMFSDDEIASMGEQLARGGELSRQDRVYMHFALGKAHADRKEFEKSFENYARANALKRGDIDYDPAHLSRHVARCRSLLSTEFFESHRRAGNDANDPIFVLGMQRAGSTLVEQILSSHSQIEATAELPDISLLAEHVGTQMTSDSGYPDGLTKLDAATCADLGARYLELTRFRRYGRPFFVDKMPYNFLHIGLIHLILPRAKIVDVRRHPMACCFSQFSLHFEAGPLFSHRLTELGRAYADYVALLAHFDTVLPGRIHRIFYEDLVREPETEIRRLLDYLELPFEEPCLRFHETRRAMSSVSAEQVRKPISGEAIDFWRNYEFWLGPLKAALGPVLHAYPGVPESAA